MNEKVVAVECRGQQYVAIVFTPKGIYHSALPRKSKQNALKAVNAIGLPISSDNTHKYICKMVFDMVQGDYVDTKSLFFDFSGLTANEVKVLKALLKVPRGKTITYGELAAEAGLPKACRFVGNVMAKNRFAPLIPCHRVIAANGLGGYGFGLDKKTELLMKEGAL